MLEKFTGTAWSQNALNLDFIRDGNGDPQETPYSFNYQDNPVREKSNYHTDLLINKVNASYYNRDGETEQLDNETIQEAIDTIGSTNCILYLKSGTWSIDADITFPKNILVEFARGAVLAVEENRTITFEGHLKVGKYQIFSGDGACNIIFGSFSNAEIYPEWWGADPSTSSDDTLAVQNSFTVARTSGGKTVKFGIGTYYVSTAGITETSGSTYLKIIGAGRGLTIIRKYGTSTDPVLFFGSSMGEWFGDIRELSIWGISTCSGLKLTNLYFFTLDTLDIKYCGKAIENLGSLVFSINNCYIQGNLTGFYNRANGGVYANHITIKNSSFMWNTTLGIDYSEGSQLNLYSCQLEGNGTDANYTTGAIMIRSNVDAESGLASLNVYGCHFENNNGWAIQTESGCGGLKLTLRDMHNMTHDIVNNPSGGILNVLSAYTVIIDNVSSGTASYPFIIASTVFSNISNCQIVSLTDTSTYKTHYNCQLALGALENATGNLQPVVINGAYNSGTGVGPNIKFMYNAGTQNSTIAHEVISTVPYLTLRGYGSHMVNFPTGIQIYNTTSLLYLDGTWNGSHIAMNNCHLWVDGSGKLRIKSSNAPTSDTDGTIVGTQT